VVNAIMDACYMSMKSGRWEPIKLAFKASGKPQAAKTPLDQGKGRGKAGKAGYVAIKTEKLPNGRTKCILKDRATGRIVEEID
jgi:hypothetical protein